MDLEAFLRRERERRRFVCLVAVAVIVSDMLYCGCYVMDWVVGVL